MDLARRRRIRKTAGFTLVELLIALTLLSLMFVMLMGGLQFGTKVWGARQQQSSDKSQELVVANLLRRLLSEARPLFVQADRTSPRHVFFVGSQDSVRFVAPMLQHLGMGGLYEVALFLEKSGQGKDLVMSWRVFPQGVEQRTTLLKNVTSLDFAFYGPFRNTEPPQWYVDWRGMQYLPYLIRVQLGNDTPGFIVAPMVQSMELIIETEQGEY